MANSYSEFRIYFTPLAVLGKTLVWVTGANTPISACAESSRESELVKDNFRKLMHKRSCHFSWITGLKRQDLSSWLQHLR